MGDMRRTVRSILRAAFTAGYFQPNMLRKPSGMVCGRVLKMYHITILFEGHWHYMKCKSLGRWLHESCKAKKGHTLWWLAEDTLYTWHRFPEAALNLTWNLNQKGRFLGDPWEGHSCVGTQWGWRASLTAAGGCRGYFPQLTELRAPVFALTWGAFMEDGDGQYSTLTWSHV